jgi:hypothetical protein
LRAILILILLTGSAMAKPLMAVKGFRHCLIKVDRKVYLHERCKVAVGTGGGATLGVDDDKPSKFFAYVHAGEGSSWNGPNGESHAHSPLGDLRRRGNCWINKRVRICIGKQMGEQRPLKSAQERREERLRNE